MRLIRTLAAAAAVLAMAAPIAAQTTARGMYTKLLAREKTVRQSIAAGRQAAAVRKDVRRVVVGYEGIVRRYPTSGYSDNALWQAGMLATESYARYRVEEDRETALRLLRWLMQEYPTSSLIRRARPAVNRLKLEGEPGRPVPAASTTPAPPGEPGPAFAGPAPEVPGHSTAQLRAVRRTVLPTLVRIAIELDRPVGYAGDTLTGPPRVFLDLESTRRGGSLPEVLPYDGTLIKTVRFGPRPDGATRVVVDLERMSRVSVFTLSNPFRIVIDVARGEDAIPAALSLPMAGGSGSGDAGAGARRGPAALPERVSVSSPEEVKPTPPIDPREGGTPAASPHAATGSRLPGRRATTRNAPLETPPVPASPSANLKGRFSLSRQLGLGVARIVIDPGHGGHDPGTSSRGLKESDIVLDVALRLEKLLLAESGVEVVLTRRTDVFIPLEDRTAIANREDADLFISIHANASRNRAARGVETYFLNFASTREAEAVAARENSSSGQTMRNLPDIVKAIALNNKLDESRDFATFVQKAMVAHLKSSNKELRDLGVKQAPFVVLIGAQMPSVLAEISFVTHVQEGRLLKTPAYRQRIAEALFRGLQQYQRALKKTVRTAAVSE